MDNLNWFAIQTRPRAEFAALADIQAMDGLEAYLPQETRQRRTRKGKETVRHPLMPGILFVGCKARSIFDVLRSRAVRDIIRAPGGEARPIRPKMVDGSPWHIVDELRQREEAGDFDFTPRRKPLVKGGKARVLVGVFKDQIGRLMSTPFEGRAEIMMDGLFAGRMTVDVRALEGVDPSSVTA